MKKLFLSLLAVAALASCSKTESAYVDQDQEIKLAPVASMSTKAVYGAIDGTTYPTKEDFDVRAYWADKPAGSKFVEGFKLYLGTEAEAVPFINKGMYWGGKTTYYWPKNGSLRFAAYSPATLNMKHTLDGDVYEINHTQESATDKTIDMLVAPTTPSYNAETATENVSVVFEHALSWITIKVKAKNPEAAKAFKVHDIIVNDAFTTATLTAAMADGIQYEEWSKQATAADYTVYSNAYPNGQDVTVESTTIESRNAKGEYRNGTIVIPQLPTTLTINYTQKAMPGTPELTDQTVTVPLELDVEGAVWEPGKHYIYTVIFDLDEILINPSVADWEDVVVDDKDMDDAGQIATVATEEELKAALAAVNEKNIHTVTEIELTSEIALTSQLNIDYSVAFTGGGFTGKPINVTGEVVSFTNVAFKNANGAKETSVYVGKNNSNISFEGCTFSEYGYEAIQYTSMTGKWINIVGCTFTAKDGAHRSVHIQPIGDEDKNNNGSNDSIETDTYLKMVDNVFNGAVPNDSYVLVYGLFHKNMKVENNTVDGIVSTDKVFFSNGFDSNNLTLKGFAEEVTTLPATLTESVILGGNVETASLALAGYDLDGAGNTLKMTSASDKMFFVTASKGYITNVNLLGTNARNANGKLTYGLVLNKAEGDVVINNVTSTDFVYALNTEISTSTSYTLTVVNSTLEGWTSFASYASAKFINTNFKIGSFFARKDANVESQNNCNFKPFVTTVLENCTFEKGFYLDLCSLATAATVTFKNCTVDGVKLTKENFATYMNLDDNHTDGPRWNNVKFE